MTAEARQELAPVETREGARCQPHGGLPCGRGRTVLHGSCSRGPARSAVDYGPESSASQGGNACKSLQAKKKNRREAPRRVGNSFRELTTFNEMAVSLS